MRTTGKGLSDLIEGGVSGQRAGYDFSKYAVDKSAVMFDRVNSRSQDTLAGIINATRDFSQRAIAAGTGQSTPIMSIPAAANNTPVMQSDTGDHSGLMILAAAATIIALFMSK